MIAGTAAPRRTFHTLDGLRGVAAIAVAFRHIPRNAIGQLTPESYLAVDLFFILSGFVLAHAYAERLAKGMSVADFLAARLIRLYPLYVLASLLTLALVLVPATHGHYHPPDRSLQTIVFAALFLPQIDPTQPGLQLFPLVGPAWSLAFELAANLVFALVATRLNTRLLAILIGVGAALLIAAAWHFGAIDLGYSQTNAWGGIGRVGFGFFAGVAAYRLWQADALPWLRLPAWAAVAIVLEIFCVQPAQFQAANDVALVIIVMPALVLASARREPGARLARPFALFGAASYGIYVLQNPVDQWYETLVPWKHVRDYGGFGSWGAVALVGATVTAALLLDRWYDVPVRAGLTRAWRRLTKGDTPARADRVPSGPV
jgi:peptidoglycan/LPS O-acetylase OafA/YrhL